MTLEGILIWSVLGLVAGILAKWIMPGNQSNNPITTILLGIAGSIAGGWCSKMLKLGDPTGNFSLVGIGTAVAGALLLMFLWGLLFGKKK